MNTYIEFVSYQQRYCVDVYQDHNDERGTNGTVYLIKVPKVIDPEWKKKAGQQYKDGCKIGAYWWQPPSLMHSRGVFVYKRNTVIHHRNDDYPSEKKYETLDGIVPNVHKLQKPIQ